jgi:SAM-dependent methyltransferase
MNLVSVQTLYRTSNEKVRGEFADNLDEAAKYYQRYVAFVMRHLKKRPARILDVGCGNGWSTYLFRKEGHEAIGTDLPAVRLEAQTIDESLPYVAADVQRLPFDRETFDAVAMHAVLEHVPEPERALRESLRVLRQGGRLIVVGPHLLSVGLSIRFAAWETIKAILRGGRWTKRSPDTAFHPFGNTLPETYQHLAHHAWQTIRKLAGERPGRFLSRQPDPRPPFHGDNDACYFCNPMDLIGWAKQTEGVRPIRWWAPDRHAARLLWPFTGGTWVVMEKSTR